VDDTFIVMTERGVERARLVNGAVMVLRAGAHEAAPVAGLPTHLLASLWALGADGVAHRALCSMDNSASRLCYYASRVDRPAHDCAGCNTIAQLQDQTLTSIPALMTSNRLTAIHALYAAHRACTAHEATARATRHAIANYSPETLMPVRANGRHVLARWHDGRLVIADEHAYLRPVHLLSRVEGAFVQVATCRVHKASCRYYTIKRAARVYCELAAVRAAHGVLCSVCFTAEERATYDELPRPARYVTPTR